MILLRPYAPEDLPEILGLFRASVHGLCGKDYTPEQLDAWAPASLDAEAWGRSLASHFALTAWEEDCLLGFADLEEPDYFDRLYVSPQAKGRGVGRLLAQAVESRSRDLGAEVLTVHASETARGFFLHRGYTLCHRQEVERRGVLLHNYQMQKTWRKECAL